MQGACPLFFRTLFPRSGAWDEDGGYFFCSHFTSESLNSTPITAVAEAS